MGLIVSEGFNPNAVDIEDCGCVRNAVIYGFNESVRRAKFPMSSDVDSPTDELTPGIAGIATSKIGSGHDQWLTGVTVQFDLTFSIKAWTEMERYSWMSFVSSQSTMHRITKFDLDHAYNQYVDERIIRIMKGKVEAYNLCDDPEERQKKYLEILYSNPCGMKLTAGMTTNYRQLKTIYAQRKNHRLPEWREFCRWIESLPYSELIITETKTLKETTHEKK